MNEKSQQCQFLTVREAAEQLGVADSTVRRAVKRGNLPAIRLARTILIPREALRPTNGNHQRG